MPLRRDQYADMQKFPKTRQKQKLRYYHKHNYATEKKRAWTVSEIDMVLQHRIPDVELAQQLHRSVQAIHSMRCRMRNRDEDDMLEYDYDD